MTFQYIFTPMESRLGCESLGEKLKRHRERCNEAKNSMPPPPPLKKIRYEWEPSSPDLFSYPVDDSVLLPLSTLSSRENLCDNAYSSDTDLNLTDIDFGVFDYLDDFDWCDNTWDDVIRVDDPLTPLSQT